MFFLKVAFTYSVSVFKLEMARAASSPIFGQSDKGFETVRGQFV